MVIIVEWKDCNLSDNADLSTMNIDSLEGAYWDRNRGVAIADLFVIAIIADLSDLYLLPDIVVMLRTVARGNVENYEEPRSVGLPLDSRGRLFRIRAKFGNRKGKYLLSYFIWRAMLAISYHLYSNTYRGAQVCKKIY